jgi:4-amino-4-deoxy-L-arabinose transferase-like glycosyltransferase
VTVARRLLAIALFAIVVWVPAYLQRSLWEPDEARYAYVAQEMRAGDHWFVPHRHGDLYAHKPPLMFWLINAGSVLTDGEIGRFATRFPSLLGVIMVLWAVGALTDLWVDRRTGWWSVLITATTFSIWWRAGWGQIDMLLCGLQMMGLYLLFADDSRSTGWRPLLAYCFFGLGILAKGPVGFIVPVGAYIAANAAAGSIRNLRRLHWLWGVPVTLSWPGAWLLAAKITGAPSAYFDELLFSQNVERAAGGLGHVRPIYYYLEYLPVDGLPWILVLPFAIWALQKHASDDQVIWRRTIGWFAFVVLFFSLIPTKRGLYILLAYPAVAITVAAGWSRLRELPRTAQYTLVALVSVVPIAGAGVLVATPWIEKIPFQPVSAWVSGALLLAGALLLLVSCFRSGTLHRWLAPVIIVFLGIYLLTAHVLLPQLNAMKTPLALVPEVQRRVPEGRPLLLYQINAEILPYYCKRPGQVYWGDVDFWRRGLRRQKRGVAVFLESVWREKESELGWLGETGTFPMGHKRFVWLAFQTNEE